MFAVPPNTIALPAAPAAAHPALVARLLAEDVARWRALLEFHTDERFVTLIERTPAQEVWLMSWLPGQGTDLHDHGPAHGAFTVVAGTLTERVERGPVPNRHQVATGQSRVFAPGYVHQVTNDGLEPAVSIHVYRPARYPARYNVTS
jgi:quercetin dioxygenase-like cupin family protein